MLHYKLYSNVYFYEIGCKMVDNIFVSKYASSKQANKQASDNIVVFSEGVMLSVYRRAYIKASLLR